MRLFLCGVRNDGLNMGESCDVKAWLTEFHGYDRLAGYAKVKNFHFAMHGQARNH